MPITTRKKAPTTTEIAQKANVSQATVYAVLNARKRTSIRVGKKTREKILHVAKKMGYVPNELARSMVTGKTHTIGVMVSTLKTGFYTDFFTCFDDVCYREGYSVLISTSEYDTGREERNLRTFLAKRVDAVVVAMDYPTPNESLLQQMNSRGVPVVYIGGIEPPSPPFPSVGFDEARVGYLAAEHLYKLGHRRVTYLAATRSPDERKIVDQRRLAWFKKAWGNLPGTEYLGIFETADPMHGGIELATALRSLSSSERFSAVACSADRLAISLISALQAEGVRVPEELSVIGCDDILDAAECIVPLSTIRLPTQRLAEGTWAMLQELLCHTERIYEDNPKRVVVNPKLVDRQSTTSYKASSNT